MSKRNNKKISKKIGFTMLAGMLVFVSCGKKEQESSKAAPPAKVENAVQESKLSTVMLSPQAEERLGIEVIKAEKRYLPGTLKIGGEIIATPGNEVKVAAPVAGTILETDRAQIPQAGKFVKKGEEILRLLFLPAGNELIGAREEVAVKQELYEVAQSKADRAKQLLASKAISEKAYEEAQVELTQAKAALNTATARFNLLSGNDLGSVEGGLSTLVLGSPLEGVLQRIYVAPGQTVPAATVLFEVASLNPVWVRVPVYIGDLYQIDLEQSALISPLGSNQQTTVLKARSIQGPPLSHADSASADLYFELSNKDRLLRIGQKVSVTLLQKSEGESLVVPESAILYDIYGGNWVYTRTAAQTYMRIRVELTHIIDGFAVISRGLNEGDEVVTAAAAEIYGTEFGVGK